MATLSSGSPRRKVTPWRNDCGTDQVTGDPCSTWNACGVVSCVYSRAGWCPGYIACHKKDTPTDPCDNDIDVTGSLLPGGSYAMDYTVTPKNGSWPVSVVVYWYE